MRMATSSFPTSEQRRKPRFMTLGTAQNSNNEEMEIIRTLNPAELREVVRRCKAKAEAYLRSAAALEAWKEGKANGTRRN